MVSKPLVSLLLVHCDDPRAPLMTNRELQQKHCKVIQYSLFLKEYEAMFIMSCALCRLLVATSVAFA